MNTQTQQRPLVERLREGCIINPKRWSGDPGEPSPVNESATEELLMEAADEIERLRAIEAQAIEQSEYVQREWLSPSEATGLKREVERLRADLDRFSEWAEEACDVIVNGVSLMTVKQLQQWEGCRAVVETCPSLLHESQEDRARWIPVTERLPQAYVPILGFRPPDDFLIAYLGDDDSSFQDNADYNTVVGVTHWMPLPPPPVQESQA